MESIMDNADASRVHTEDAPEAPPDREARVREALAAKGSVMVGPCIAEYYDSYASLWIDMQRLGGLTWAVDTTRTKNDHEKGAAYRKARHVNKCDKRDRGLPCNYCTRVRRLFADHYQRTFCGRGESYGAKLVATAVCICPFKNTHCLGCVVHVAMEFPVALETLDRAVPPGAPRKTRKKRRLSPIRRTAATAANDGNLAKRPRVARKLDFAIYNINIVKVVVNGQPPRDQLRLPSTSPAIESISVISSHGNRSANINC